MPRTPARIIPPLAGAILGAVLAVIAFGSPASPTILDTEKVERAIERSSLEQRQKVARASCPAGVRQSKGRTFTCTVAVGKATTRFRVVQLDDGGRVRYEASG
jgi:hypothetical protein